MYEEMSWMLLLAKNMSVSERKNLKDTCGNGCWLTDGMETPGFTNHKVCKWECIVGVALVLNLNLQHCNDCMHYCLPYSTGRCWLHMGQTDPDQIMGMQPLA